MTRPAVTPEELHAAFVDLATIAAGVATGRTDARGRRALRRAVQDAQRMLAAPVADVSSRAIADPDVMVRAYSDGGGEWQKLVAAVSRNSLAGATRKAS